MNTVVDLIRDYLMRLEAAAAGLPDEVRRDVLDDVETHLEEVLAGDPSEAEVLQALDRLGTPEAIAAAAGSEFDQDDGPQVGFAARAPARPNGTGVRARDVRAVLLLVFGVVVTGPFLGPLAFAVWLAGVVLLWASPAWTRGEKTLAIMVWPGGMAFPLQAVMLLEATMCINPVEEQVPVTLADGSVVASGMTTGGCSFPLWIGLPLWVVLLGAPVVVGTVLLRRANHRGHATVETPAGRQGVA